jgi:uncharacterized protein
LTINLRAHHLLCLLTYVGKGYSPEFTANYDAVAVRLSAGEDVLLVAGTDDICAPLLGEMDPHCRRDSVNLRDDRAAEDLTTLLGRSVRPGTSITLGSKLLAQMRAAFSGGITRRACSRCEWADLCTQVAASEYGEARVQAVVA